MILVNSRFFLWMNWGLNHTRVWFRTKSYTCMINGKIIHVYDLGQNSNTWLIVGKNHTRVLFRPKSHTCTIKAKIIHGYDLAKSKRSLQMTFDEKQTRVMILPRKRTFIHVLHKCLSEFCARINSYTCMIGLSHKRVCRWTKVPCT